MFEQFDPSFGIRPVLPDLDLSGVFADLAGVQSFLGALDLTMPKETKDALVNVIRKVSLVHSFQIENPSRCWIEEQQMIDIDLAFNKPLELTPESMVNWMNTIHQQLFDGSNHFQAGVMDFPSSVGVVRKTEVIEKLERQVCYLEDFMLRRSPNHRLTRVIISLSVHQRLSRLEPYSYGSGLVSRILLEKYLSDQSGPAQIGYKLLPIARGFAGQDLGVIYKKEMRDASRPAIRASKKGALCPISLMDFLSYCTQTMLQQAQVMYLYLKRDNFKGNLLKLFSFIDSKHANQMLALYLKCFDEGVFERMTAASVCGLSERASRDILRMLIDLGFLISNSPKGKLTIGFPFIYLGRVFPRLMPVYYEREWEQEIFHQKQQRQQMRLF